jgi:hypothetical protein
VGLVCVFMGNANGGPIHVRIHDRAMHVFVYVVILYLSMYVCKKKSYMFELTDSDVVPCASWGQVRLPALQTA